MRVAFELDIVVIAERAPGHVPAPGQLGLVARQGGGVLGFWGAVGSGASFVDAENCINRAKIVLEGCGANDSGIGGICGNSKGGTIKNCANFGSIVTTYVGKRTANAGGFVGIVTASTGALVLENVINCANITGWTRAGGIFGYVYSGHEGLTLKNVYSFTNNVIVNSETGSAGTIIGGIRNKDQKVSIDGATAVAIDGLPYVGGEIAATENLMSLITSPSDLELDSTYKAILTALGVESLTMPVPPSEETDPIGPVAPETDPVEDTESEPESEPESDPVEDTKPEETDPTTPVETDPVQTPSTEAPGTEKPAEGGCGSVVAGGLAILAVVALAGVALKKRD